MIANGKLTASTNVLVVGRCLSGQEIKDIFEGSQESLKEAVKDLTELAKRNKVELYELKALH